MALYINFHSFIHLSREQSQAIDVEIEELLSKDALQSHRG